MQQRAPPGMLAPGMLAPQVMQPMMAGMQHMMAPQPWGFGAPLQYAAPAPAAPPPQSAPPQTVAAPPAQQAAAAAQQAQQAAYKAAMPNAGLRGKAASIPGIQHVLAARGLT